MITLKGKYNQATVFTDKIDSTTTSQIIELCNQEWTKDSVIKVMPDCHAGKGCVIGTTMPITDKLCPSIVGLDIGCGVLCVDITGLNINLDEVDSFIHNNVPSGHDNNDVELTDFKEYESLISYKYLKNPGIFGKAIGSLGSGNHYIEINETADGRTYLVIHTGSRNLGKQVAEYWQDVAIDLWKNSGHKHLELRNNIIKALKDEKRGSDIAGALKAFDERYASAKPAYPKELCYLFGEHMEGYIHDMKICQEYASLNRATIASTILVGLGSSFFAHEHFETIHNYINFKDGIMRKGAVSAQAGEKLIIPMNMRDGSLICIGKGNADWNFSAPHGAGRIMSRSDAKRSISMEDYASSMEGIYTSCVSNDTLDESPMAYKPMEEIIANIGDTVTVVERIKPNYNFKAGE